MGFYTKDSPLRRWILWRSSSEVIVQPLIGRGRQFELSRRRSGKHGWGARLTSQGASVGGDNSPALKWD